MSDFGHLFLTEYVRDSLFAEIETAKRRLKDNGYDLTVEMAAGSRQISSVTDPANLPESFSTDIVASRGSFKRGIGRANIQTGFDRRPGGGIDATIDSKQIALLDPVIAELADRDNILPQSNLISDEIQAAMAAAEAQRLDEIETPGTANAPLLGTCEANALALADHLTDRGGHPWLVFGGLDFEREPVPPTFREAYHQRQHHVWVVVDRLDRGITHLDLCSDLEANFGQRLMTTTPPDTYVGYGAVDAGAVDADRIDADVLEWAEENHRVVHC